MNQLNERSIVSLAMSLIIAMIAVLMFGGLQSADAEEPYVCMQISNTVPGTGDQIYPANVMFLLDASSSMDASFQCPPDYCKFLSCSASHRNIT